MKLTIRATAHDQHPARGRGAAGSWMGSPAIADTEDVSNQRT
jgi:hypothetical protein